jgi:hypothetical protein
MPPQTSQSFTVFSGFLFHTMHQFARSSQELEQEADPKREGENRSYALGAVMASAAFLESHINELFMLASEDAMHYAALPSTAKQGMKAVWEDVSQKLAILPKYDLALALSDRPELDRGGLAYQDADTLVLLRNAIMHYKTGFRSHPDPEPLKVEQRLEKKFPVCTYYRNTPGPLFPHRCLGAGCAVWAVTSAERFADAFHERLGIRGPYQYLQNIPTLLQA